MPELAEGGRVSTFLLAYVKENMDANGRIRKANVFKEESNTEIESRFGSGVLVKRKSLKEFVIFFLLVLVLDESSVGAYLTFRRFR